MRILVWADTHIPYHDPAAVDAIGQAVRIVRPDEVHHLGDLLDCRPLSLKFKDDSPDVRAQRFEFERQIAVRLLERLRSQYKGPIHLHEGNHEHRLRRYLAERAKPLMELPNLSVPELLQLGRLGIQWHPYGQVIRRGALCLTHGDLVRSQSAYSAKAMLEKYGRSVVFGHTHRAGVYWKTTGAGPQVAVEVGCTCALEQHYTIGPNNWQQGFVVLDLCGKHFELHLVPLHRGAFVWGGKLYTVRAIPKHQRLTHGLGRAREHRQRTAGTKLQPDRRRSG